MSYSSHSLASRRISILLLMAVILLGFWFRVTNLADKIFWVDEVSTAVRVSGYTVGGVSADLAQQDVVDRSILDSYQTTDSGRTLRDSLDALRQSPEHAPLYFLLTRFWLQWLGNGVGSIRSLAVVFSLFVLPSLYWLCQEFFSELSNKTRISWLAVAIVSISPFHVVYAQEARPYSLWTAAILLMGASFFRAIRLNNRSVWLLHSLCLILGFYTSLFSIYVAAFQGVYLLLTFQRKKWSVVRNFVLSGLTATLAFSPWIFVIINHLSLLQENTSWMRGNFNLADIIAVYIGTNLLAFGDLPLSPNANPIQVAIALLIIVLSLLVGIKYYPRWQNRPLKFALLLLVTSLAVILSRYIYLDQRSEQAPSFYGGVISDWVTIIGALVAVGILSLSFYSLYYLITQTKRDRWLYLSCLMLSLPLPLLIIDIVNQGQGSTAPRYLIPLQLGIIIAVAFTVGSKLSIELNSNSSHQKRWRLIAIAMLILGIYSCGRNLSLSPFYQKGRNVNNTAIATLINQRNSALVIGEELETMDVISLAYSLKPEVRYKILDQENNIAPYLTQFDYVFLLKPSPQLKQKLTSDLQIAAEQIYRSPVFSEDEFPLDLWSLKIQ
ncbi:MAG: glycosyltransferase family 39 protein [Cyanobacteria bacterium J06629_2]